MPIKPSDFLNHSMDQSSIQGVDESFMTRKIENTPAF
jgi:hypothetical protein